MFFRSGGLMSTINQQRIKDHLDLVYNHVNDLFKYDLQEDTYIAGGAIASLAQGESPRDYDFYFYNKEQLGKFIVILKLNEIPFKETDKAITLNVFAEGLGYIVLQFIKCWYGVPHLMITKFDFYHSMNYYDGENLIIVHPQCIEYRALYYNPNCKNPNGAPSRYLKFVSRGYEPNDLVAHYIIASLKFDEPLVDSYE